MCGRFVMLSADEIADVVAAVEQRGRIRTLSREDGAARPHAHPGSSIATIGMDDGTLGASDRIWGFTPDWSTKPIFNTRIEKALSGAGMWTQAFEEGRCIVPAAAFFEPHATETMPSPRTGRPMKRAYAFATEDGAPLLMAGLRDRERCSVVTPEPNRWVSPVHNRMPLLLRFEEAEAWLAEGAVPSSVTDFALDVGPEFPDIAPVEPPDQLSLF